MSRNRMVGLVICAIGLVILVIAYQASNAPMEELANKFTGHYSDKTTWYFVVGIAAILGGGLLATFESRK